MTESSRPELRLPRHCCSVSGDLGILPPGKRSQPVVTMDELHLQRRRKRGFVDELGARFGPTDFEDPDKALTRIK